ncbi:MAG: ribonuclease P protein component [Piscirickettsiaceae bacterium]|nr:ribonuclease P protein component [Piscirickettsiaceae bacterium]
MKISDPKDFSLAFRSGKRTRKGGGIIVITVENLVGYPRLGLAIAKKHLKLSCHRNCLKRIIRNSFRLNQFLFAEIDIVVLSRTDINQHNSGQMQASLELYWSTVATRWQRS